MSDYADLLAPRTQRVVEDAGFLRRTGAFVIDVLLLDIVLMAPFTHVFAGIAAQAQQGSLLDVAYTSRELAAMVALFLLAYGYFVMFEYVLGQTVGMMLARTRVEEGGRLWQHLVRNSMLLPFFPFILFWVIEPLAILFSGRGMLERLSGTRTRHPREVAL